MPFNVRILDALAVAAMLFPSAASAQSLERARQLFDDSRYVEAKTELVALRKVDDRSSAAAYYLGRIAFIHNDLDESIRLFERAIDLEEGNGLYHYWLGTALREVAPRVSKIKLAFHARRMRKEWERAVALDPNLIDARSGLVQFYAMAPGAMGGSKDKAREQVSELAKRNPLRAAIARGVIAAVEKNTVAEEAAYRQAIAASPDSAAGYFALGYMYALGETAPEAFAALDQYARRQPSDRRALYEAGRFAGMTGQQLERGETSLRQFLASPPADVLVSQLAGAHYWLGQIAEKRGAVDGAREHYRAALKINPKNQFAERALKALK